MIYTDGFVNEETYFSQGHIWHFGMKWRGKESLFVCIFRVCPDKDSKSVERVLRSWIEQELPQAMEKGDAEIQREVNRFCAWFKQWCGMGNATESPVLCLCFQGHIYWGAGEKTLWSRFEGHRGLILDLEDAWNREEYRDKCDTEILNTDKSVEEIANQLKTDMMAAYSKGTFKTGYFVMWEEQDDF